MPVCSSCTGSHGQSANQAIYAKEFRRHVHQLLLMGYRRLDAPSCRSFEEERISGDLKEAMRLITEDEDVDEWAVHLTVRDEAPVNLPGIHGRRRPRIDLEVERTQRGRHPRWRFEAKRLRNDTSVEAYMGSDGLGCYLVGRYAADQEEAGMLGYVQSQDEQTWAGQISDCIATNPGTCRVRTDGQWRGCDVVDGLDYCYSTKHDRDAPLGPIEVTHVLLRFH